MELKIETKKTYQLQLSEDEIIVVLGSLETAYKEDFNKACLSDSHKKKAKELYNKLEQRLF